MRDNKCTMKINLLFATLALLLTSSTAHALSTSDQDLATNSYNNAFYVVSNGAGHFVLDTQGRAIPDKWVFWKMAEEMEAIEDAYDRSHNPIYKGMVDELYNGFVQLAGTDWSWNDYNDDICWACIAFIRAYHVTGNHDYLNTALGNYNMMWNRAYDDKLGGGLWWNRGKSGKNACVNGPGAIVAAMLYRDGESKTYLTRARSLVDWEVATLVNPTTGSIADNINAAGVVQGGPTSYNQGTFIGACDLIDLGMKSKTYDTDANLAASFVENKMSGRKLDGVLNDCYGDGQGASDVAGFNGIFARWVGRWIKDSGHTEYDAWLVRSAEAAWNCRNPSGISWGHWWEPTPSGSNLTAWECSDTVAMVNDVPDLMADDALR